MEEWGLKCSLVAGPGVSEQVVRDACKREGIAPEVLSFDHAVTGVGAMLLPPGSEPSADVFRTLKSYAENGGWLVIPEGASIVSQLLDVPERRTAKLNSLPGSHVLLGRHTATEARPLVSHPVLTGFLCREWLSAETLSGEAAALDPQKKLGLSLMLFKNPSAEGVEVIPVKEGGIVHLNWELYDGGQVGSKDAREVLRNVLVWLTERRTWVQPYEQPGFAVRGKVVDMEEVPLAKATVRAKVFADWGSVASEVETMSADDGSFSLSALAPSVYQFEVSAEGYGQEDPFVMARCEFGSDAEPTIIRMRRTVALYGTVRYGSDAGAAAPDFPVQLVPADRDTHSQAQKTTTDAKGEFAFEKVEHGRTILLSAEKDEWVGMKVVELPLKVDEVPERVDLTVFQVPEIRGKVIDGETEQPIPEAKVKIEFSFAYFTEPKVSLFEGRLTRVLETDEQANFAVRVPMGGWHLDPAAEGYVTWWHEREGEYDFGAADVMVSETSPKHPVVLKLERFPLVRFYGTVYLPSGQPAPGATVVTADGVRVADSSGWYATEPVSRILHGWRKGPPYQFFFRVFCADLAVQETVELEELPKEARHDFWLEEGTSIGGFVRDPEGKAMEGARVFVSRGLFAPAVQSEETVSAPDGSFHLRGVPRAYFHELLRAEKTVQTATGSVMYVGEAGVQLSLLDEPLEGVEIVIARVGGLSGRALHHDGTPLRNARLSFKPFYSTGKPWTSYIGPGYFPVILNDEGEFDVDMPCLLGMRGPEEIPEDAGTWDFVVRKHGGFEDGVLTADSVILLKGVEAGTSGLEIRFPAAGGITARVVDADTGEPIENPCVCIRAEGEAIPGQWDDPVVQGSPGRFADGRLRIEGIVPRAHTLSVESEGYRDVTIGGLDVRSAETVDVGEVAMARRWAISAKVIDPVTGQAVPATVKAGTETRRTQDAEGSFWLELSPTPELEIEIIPDDERWQPTTLRVTYDGKPEIHLGEIPLTRRQN